jgi:hypothetical protein
MLRFTSILTLVVWAAVLAVNARATWSQRLQPRTIILALEQPVILVACCAIALAVVALVRRSRVAIWTLLVLSVVAGFVAGFNAWMMISPIAFMGVRYFQGTTVAGWLWLVGSLTLFFLPWLWAIVCYRLHARVTRAATKGFAIVGVLFLMAGAWTLYRAQTDRWIILKVPVALQTGATISQTFTVDRRTSYDLEIECERTHEAAEAGNDLDDALRDGLEADASIMVNGRPIENVNCSDPEHMRGGGGFFSRVLCTFDARPGKTYNLALHIIRYGQGSSSRDHKSASTWDENLTIPEEAHPMLKVEVDPHDYESVAGSVLLLFITGFVCLVPLLKFCVLQIFRRATPNI